MEWNRIFGILFSGFMVKLYAALIALTVASAVWTLLTETSDRIETAFQTIQEQGNQERD